jgi:hypothetical protein
MIPSRRDADACILHACDVPFTIANYNVMGTSTTDKCTSILNLRWGSRRYMGLKKNAKLVLSPFSLSYLVGGLTLVTVTYQQHGIPFQRLTGIYSRLKKPRPYNSNPKNRFQQKAIRPSTTFNRNQTPKSTPTWNSMQLNIADEAEHQRHLTMNHTAPG